MPASLYSEMDRSSKALEESRALELALELTMLGLSSDSTTNSNSENDGINATFPDDSRGKKSQNMTECVPVPSSEHVAEIVGRQGCKIKALRAKTNTYIKTPVRGEEPVFVVTGRREDVTAAKREILSAAEHFSQIRASRKANMNGSMAPGPPAIPGQVTIQVRVPYRVVGLVVGPKGATIKRIQQQTHTYIVTPSRDKEPVFEVTGLPENVGLARKEIEAHIALRTGGIFDNHDDNDFHTNGIDIGTNDLVTLCKNNLGNLDRMNTLNDLNSAYSAFDSNNYLSRPSDGGIFQFSPKLSDLSSGLASGLNGLSHDDIPLDSNSSIWADLGKGLGLSALGSSGLTNGFSSGLSNLTNTLTTIGLARRSSSLGSSGGTPSRLTPPLSDSHPPARRMNSDPLTGLGPALNGFSAPANLVGSTVSTPNSGSPDPLGGRKKRDCVVCYDSEIVAALVPCGHNLFCMECANRLVENGDGECPACHHPVSSAIRIVS